MSDEWDEHNRSVSAWQAAGDAARLALPDLYEAGFGCHETDPDRSLALFTRGRDEAARLGESWWVLFFESWRLTALTAYAMDFARALPVAAELMPRFEAPAARRHPWRVGVLINVVYTHAQVDPAGFRADIKRGFAGLDADIPAGPVSHRFVLNLRRTFFLRQLDLWAEADDLALRTLALADGADASNRLWFGAWILLELCGIADTRGERDRVLGHAAHMAEVSARHPQLGRTRAAAAFWQAVGEQLRGDERAARRAYLTGVGDAGRLDRKDTIFADPLARYHELAGDLAAALEVRDRELTDAERTGRHHRACQVHAERLRLLARSGGVSPDAVAAARRAAEKLHDPDRFLAAYASFAVPPTS